MIRKTEGTPSKVQLHILTLFIMKQVTINNLNSFFCYLLQI